MKSWIVGCCALCLWLTGCAYEFQSVGKKPEIETPPISRKLNIDVANALSGQGETARQYYGLYEAMATCVSNPKYPWRLSREIEEDVVRAREILDLKHGEYPEFTRVVSEHLAPLKENRELSVELRREWCQKLKELAEACRGAALREQL